MLIYSRVVCNSLIFGVHTHAAQVGLQVESPIVRGLGLIGLVGWGAMWITIARRLGRAGQLKGDNDVY